MLVTKQWIYDGSRAQAWADCGLAVLQPTGVVTPPVRVALLTDAQWAVGRWGSDALVARYTDAAVQMDVDTLMDTALEAVRVGPGRMDIPTAMVVRREELKLWRTYCELMAMVGIVRGAFLEHEEAMRWARRQALVFSADRLCR